MKKKRILHIVPNMQVGGLETFIMNMMRNIDKDKINFDFLVHYEKECFYDKEIKKLGGKIYRFSLREDNNIIKYIKELNKFFKEHKEYEIIHCHMESIAFLVFLIAKHNGVKVRILHSHNINTEPTLKGRIKFILSRFAPLLSTDNFACSAEAGKFLFGKRKYKVVENAIDLDRFKYSETKRNRIRKELKINDDTILIGHIGRFCKQKNQIKLIDTFIKYHEKNNNSKLVLVGAGEDKETIIKMCEDNNIVNDVIFLSNRSDTDQLYCGFDMFVFPSLFEGLGIVLIEAQLSGLMCYTSKDRVPLEACISNNLKYIDLNEDWDTYLITNNKYDRRKVVFNDNKDNYDIKKLVNKMEKFYLSK